MTHGANVPRVYRSEALVLSARDFGEADRLLAIYTPLHGKIRAIAKGVLRTTSRMSGHVDLFTHSTLLIARGRQLDIITQAETIEAFGPMRSNLWRTTLGYYVAELVDAFGAEGQANFPVFSLAVKTFRRLATQPSPEMSVRVFEMELLSLVGFRPRLHECVSCGSLIHPDRNAFSARLGGVLCPSCSAVDPSASEISTGALKGLRNLQTNGEAVLKLGTFPRDTFREVGRLSQDYIAHRLEMHPRSLHLIERVRSEGGAT